MTLLDDYYELKKNRNSNPNNYNPYDDGKSILSPLDTEIRIDCIIYDAENIVYPKADGTYEFEFQNGSSMDYAKLESKIDEACHRWDMHKGFQLDKTAFNHIQTRYGIFKCSQLYSPKLNEKSDSHYFGMQLAGRYASLSLHLRDGPDGQIYLQCSYCDLYQAIEPENIEPITDGDEIDF